LAGHAAFFSGLAAYRKTPLDNGSYAVDIFMFISGFLMTYHYRLREDRETWESSTTWGKFYVRRFFRIAPLYYFLLTVVLIFRSHLYQCNLRIMSVFPPPWAKLLHLPPNVPPLGVASIASHYSFLFGLFPKYCADNNLPDWSIGLEMQFYLVFPFLMLLFRRFGYLFITAACLVAWRVAHHLFGVYVINPPKLLGLFDQPSFLPLKIECFVFGILTAEGYWFRTLKPDVSKILLFLTAMILIVTESSIYLKGAIVVCVYFLFSRGPSITGQRVAQTVEESLLASRFAQFLADTSYSIYLIHAPTLILVTSFLAGQKWFVTLSPPVRFLLLLGVVITICYPVAFILFKMIEQPGISVGHRMVKTIGKFRRSRSQLNALDLQPAPK
jgi:peptidoglycan/LPS O-acetylase OafA/YrhL